MSCRYFIKFSVRLITECLCKIRLNLMVKIEQNSGDKGDIEKCILTLIKVSDIVKLGDYFD